MLFRFWLACGWEEGMAQKRNGTSLIVTCICGRNWLLRRFKLPATNQDSVDCTCGQPLKEWHSAYAWSAEPDPPGDFSDPDGPPDLKPARPRCDGHHNCHPTRSHTVA